MPCRQLVTTLAGNDFEKDKERFTWEEIRSDVFRFLLLPLITFKVLQLNQASFNQTQRLSETKYNIVETKLTLLMDVPVSNFVKVVLLFLPRNLSVAPTCMPELLQYSHLSLCSI